MPENKPYTPSQRAANEAAAKKKSKEVEASTETEVNKGDLGAAAREAAKRRANPSTMVEEDSPLVAAAKKKKAAAEAQKKALKDQ